ncbi:hypothetical protein NAEGRDRAFT_56420 [Naegleria gruberi]|uniref:Uncharacterized protein n=1 Tax=Naegleria gruberi TaxID=5762 RepID=D2UXH6_NAEGR|nr:uncharacterized protein NAEGRDRAFT_56420 [Naegleria gruberi]EFC50287.1 hypothetical protein NAEGRDRAFT_56420 [Naegleria gruberi]|eukprot:XP_002683031.1 hypothetical protein NAEGRDRAFT_56420 [Naegleria gruberi strain NEG-M]
MTDSNNKSLTPLSEFRLRNPRDFIRIQTEDIHNMFFELRRTEQDADKRLFSNSEKLLKQMQDLAEEQKRVLSGYNYNALVEDNHSIRNEIVNRSLVKQQDIQRRHSIKKLEKQIRQDHSRYQREDQIDQKSEGFFRGGQENGAFHEVAFLNLKNNNIQATIDTNFLDNTYFENCIEQENSQENKTPPIRMFHSKSLRRKC